MYVLDSLQDNGSLFQYEVHYILHLVHIHVVSFYDKLSEDSGSFFRFCFSQT